MATIHGIAKIKTQSVYHDAVHTKKETRVQNTDWYVKVECSDADWYFREFIAYIVFLIGTDWI